MLGALRVTANERGVVDRPRDELAGLAGVARSTLQLAISDLVAAGEIVVAEQSLGGHSNTHRLLRPIPTEDRPESPTDLQPTDPPTPTDQLSVDAPAREPAQAAPERGGSPPTPSPVESGPPNPAGPMREPAPASAQGDRPIGSLAVAAAMEAAKAAGRSIEPSLRARIGNAAQQLAKDESVERILAGARRLGEGGFADLYTAVRAVERGAPPPAPAPAPIAEGSRLQPVLRLFYATWPRAVIDAETWEAELERIPVEYLLAGVRQIARSGEKFPPSWGEVYKAAYRIGVDETERRRSAAERLRLRERVTAIEKGRA